MDHRIMGSLIVIDLINVSKGMVDVPGLNDVLGRYQRQCGSSIDICVTYWISSIINVVIIYYYWLSMMVDYWLMTGTDYWLAIRAYGWLPLSIDYRLSLMTYYIFLISISNWMLSVCVIHIMLLVGYGDWTFSLTDVRVVNDLALPSISYAYPTWRGGHLSADRTRLFPLVLHIWVVSGNDSRL